MDGDDLDLLMAIFDSDGDGVISLRDFATIGSWAPPREVATEAVHKLMVGAGAGVAGRARAAQGGSELLRVGRGALGLLRAGRGVCVRINQGVVGRVDVHGAVAY